MLYSFSGSSKIHCWICLLKYSLFKTCCIYHTKNSIENQLFKSMTKVILLSKDVNILEKQKQNTTSSIILEIKLKLVGSCPKILYTCWSRQSKIRLQRLSFFCNSLFTSYKLNLLVLPRLLH